MQQRIEVILDHSLYPMGRAGIRDAASLPLAAAAGLGRDCSMARRPNRTAAAFRPGTRTLFFQLPAKNWATLAVLLLLCFWWRSSFAAWWWPGRLKTPMGALICVGFAAMLGFQMLENIGMCIFVMPVIGLTLPFSAMAAHPFWRCLPLWGLYPVSRCGRFRNGCGIEQKTNARGSIRGAFVLFSLPAPECGAAGPAAVSCSSCARAALRRSWICSTFWRAAACWAVFRMQSRTAQLENTSSKK